MKSKALAALLLLAAVAGCRRVPLPEKLEMRPIQFKVRDLRFPSGLRVIAEEDKRAPVVAVVTVVGVGSSHDPQGKAGLAHLLEHLTFRSRSQDGRTLQRRLDRAGVGRSNAETKFDLTTYYAEGPRESAGELLAIEGQRITAPLKYVRSEDFTRERDVVLNELRERNESGMATQILGWLQEDAFPPAHPYVRPIGGTEQSVNALTLELARAFAKSYYRPDNVTLVISGDIDLATIDKLVAAALPEELLLGNSGAFGSRLASLPPEPLDRPQQEMIQRRQGNVLAPELWLGWTLPRGYDNATLVDFVTAAVSAFASGAEGAESDVADVNTSLLRGARSSLLIVRARLREGKNPQKSADEIVRQVSWLGRLNQGGHYQDVMMASVKRNTLTGEAINIEDILYRARVRAELTHFTGDLGALSKLQQSVASLDAREAADFVHNYFTRERARLLLVTPAPPESQPPSLVTGVGTGAGAAPVLEEPPALPIFDRAPGASRFHTFTLGNGLEVFVGQMPGMPLATVGLSFHGGAAVEQKPGVAELARYVAHRYDESDGDPDELGVHPSRSIYSDEIRYMMRGASGNTVNMLAMVLERARTVRVGVGSLDYARENVFPFERLDEQRADNVAERALWARLYGDHPYGRVATVDMVEKLNEGDVEEWIRRTHVPSNAVLAVVGDVDPAQVEKWVIALYSGWQGPAGGALAVAPPPAPAGTSRVRLVMTSRAKAAQARLQLACHLPNAGEGALPLDELLATLVESRLTNELREANGVTYGAHARATVRRGGAADLVVSTSVERSHLKTSYEATLGLLRAYADGKFLDHELASARAALAREYALRFTTGAGWVENVLDTRNRDVPISELDRYPALLKAITPEQVQAAFQRCLATPPVLSLMGDAEVLREALPETAAK